MGDKLIVIGVTGQPASGKDAVADYIVSKGFFGISGGDILREEMKKLGIPTDRSSIHDFVSEVRKRRGNGYPADEAVKMVKGSAVVSGLRNREEVRVFKEKFGKNFTLVAVKAPLEIRYARAKERGRVGDDISLERFRAEEEREKAAESGSHDVDFVVKMADVVIENDGTLEDLYRKVDQFLESVGKGL